MESKSNNELYSPVEQAFISDWLGVQRPDSAADIVLAENYEDESVVDDGQEVDSHILLRHTEYDDTDLAIRNAVARLALSGVQGHLPQWSCTNKEGDVVLARHYNPERRLKVDALPKFLFMINWADSGPGFSWPESYFATYLPGFGVYVVTLSQDSTDAYGYEDLAMGWFRPEEGIIEGSHRIITNEWRRQYEEYDQQCWEYLFETGLVDSAQASEWANEVWPEEEEEDEDESE